MTNLVVIEPNNNYTFYVDRNKVASVQSSDMTPEYIEFYRKNPNELIKYIAGIPEPA